MKSKQRKDNQTRNQRYYQLHRTAILQQKKIARLRQAKLPKEIKQARIMELLND